MLKKAQNQRKAIRFFNIPTDTVSAFEDRIKNEDESYFNQIKNGIKEKYLNQNYFSISYEELYYNNGFQKVLDYLNMDELENKNFPYGQKYRIDDNKPKSLIQYRRM